MTAQNDLDARLVAFVDGELADADAAEIERLIAVDTKARESVEMFRATAMLLRAACGEQHYRTQAAVPRPSARAPGLSRRRAAMAMAAGIALAIGGFGAGLSWRGTGPGTDPGAASGSDPGAGDLLDEAAEYHAVFSRETDHLAEVPASRAGEFVRWMSSRLGTQLSVPDLRAAGLAYVGGRMLVIGGAPVADFLYRRGDGVAIALCVARNAAADAPVTVAERHALRIAHWSRDGRTYLLVGAVDGATARDLARMAAPQV